MNIQSKFHKLRKKIIWQIDIPVQFFEAEAIHLDLGAGNVPRNPFNAKTVYATDFHASFVSKEGFQFVQSDLTRTLPFDDNSVWSVSAYDVLEHIPRWERTQGEIEFPFINLMNEIYRILRPGGFFLSVMPAYPNQEAFMDPTHVNIMSKSTIKYIALPEPWAKILGYGLIEGYEVEAQCWLRGNGPYREESILSTQGSRNKFKDFEKFWILLFRFLNLKKSKKACPLLWVLRKPD